MLAKLEKKDKKKIIIYILLIALCITMIPITSLGDERDPLDITEYVDFDSYDIFLKDTNTQIVNKGELVSGASVKVGDGVYFKYYWHITNDNMEYVTPGAFFTINLPASAFNFTAISESANYAVMSGKTQIGTLTLIKKNSNATIKVVLNEKAANANEIKDGWIRADGSVSNVSEDSTSAAIDNLIIPIEVDTESGGGSTTTYNDGPNWSWGNGDKNSFYKSSYFNQYTGKAQYTLYINNDRYSSAFAGAEIDTFNNVVIEDELQEGIKYVDGSLELYTRHYMAKGTNTTTSPAVSPVAMSSSYFGTSNFISQFTEYTPVDSDMDYDDFKADIASKKVPTYGIWQNKKIVVNIGNLPGELKFEHTWKEIKEMIDNAHQTVTWTTYEKATDESIKLDGEGKPTVESTTTSEAFSASVKQATKEAWAKLYGVPVDDMDNEKYDRYRGDVIGLYMRFNTQVTGADRSVTNVAVMYYGNDQKTSNTNKYSFYSMSGGADLGQPGDVRLTKYDGADNTVLSGVEFKLQKYDKKSEEYKDISKGEIGSGILTTDDDGLIMVKELPYGKYKFVETGWLDGYKQETSFYEGDGTFEINGTETDVINVVALNYPEETEDPETTPPSILGDESKDDTDDSSVLGDEAYDDTDDDDGSVLGEEAKTGDLNSLTWTLIAILLASAVALIVTLRRIYAKQ